MVPFLVQHQFGAVVTAYWLFSAAVSSMPEPDSKSASGYLWLYRFCHTMAGNITTAFGSRIPGLKIFALVLLIPLALSTTACAARYAVHPGALNPTDSAAYDMLLIAQATVDQLRADFQESSIPPETKNALNRLVESYNIARESWLTYRGALLANVPADAYFQQLTRNLTDLTTAIRALQQVKE